MKEKKANSPEKQKLLCMSTCIDLNLYRNGANDRDRASLFARALSAKWKEKKFKKKKTNSTGVL